MGVQVAVAGVHGEQSAPVRQSMVSQVRQGTVQLLLEQGGAFFRGGGGLLTHIPVGAAGHRSLGADGITPLTVVRRAGTLVLCKGRQTETEEEVLILKL